MPERPAPDPARLDVAAVFVAAQTKQPLAEVAAIPSTTAEAVGGGGGGDEDGGSNDADEGENEGSEGFSEDSEDDVPF